jgi:hypothetical protein
MKKILKLAFVLGLFFIGMHAALAACGDSITGGTGTAIDPYLIDTPAELAAINNCVGVGNSDKHFRMTTDINLNVSPYNTGSGWTPIGSGGSQFYGTFNGYNHTISNLFIDRGSSEGVGLFGYIGSGGVVEKVYLSNVTINGGGNAIAGLAGSSSGTVRDAGVTTGTITGLMRMGGVIGTNTGTAARIFSKGLTITQKAAGAECCIGGITGATEFGGAIEDAYARSNIVHTSGGQGVLGGGIGSTFNASSVANLFSTGTITTLSEYPVQDGGLIGNFGTPALNSYWDTETSGWDTSGSGTGKTTAEMKDINTYNGWNFMTVWDIDGVTNDGYPFLQLGDITPPTVFSLFPADNSTGASTTDNFVIIFSEPMAIGTGNIVIKKTSDDSIVETIDVTSDQITHDGMFQNIYIQPSVSLDEQTSYYVQIDPTALLDQHGNYFAGISGTTTWNFTTGDFTAPVLTEIAQIPSVTTDLGVTYRFRTSEACTTLAEAPSSTKGQVASIIGDTSTPDTDIPVRLSGIQYDGTYSVSFTCQDSSGNTSNTLTMGPFSTRSPASGTSVGSSSLAIIKSGPAIASESGAHAPFTFMRTLKLNMRGADVKELQKLLNAKGFVITATGAGSLGNETDLFGSLTKKALIKFQVSKGLKPDGVFGSKTQFILTAS